MTYIKKEMATPGRFQALLFPCISLVKKAEARAASGPGFPHLCSKMSTSTKPKTDFDFDFSKMQSQEKLENKRKGGGDTEAVVGKQKEAEKAVNKQASQSLQQGHTKRKPPPRRPWSATPQA